MEEESSSSKRQRREYEKKKVLYVAMGFRLIGIDLDAVFETTTAAALKSYHRGSGNFPTPTPEVLVCNLDYKACDLPLCMSAMPSPDSSSIYLIGGEHATRGGRGPMRSYFEEDLSVQIYKFDPSSKVYVPPEPVGVMCAPKSRPLVETLNGKTYALGRMPSCGSLIGSPYPSPILELLDLSLVDSSDPNRVIGVGLDDVLLQLPGQYLFMEVSGYFVIGTRMFLYLSYNVEIDDPMSCYDATARGRFGDWLTEEEDGIDFIAVKKSFLSSHLCPLAGKSVSVANGANSNDDDDLYVLLFTSPEDHEYYYVRYFAGIVNKSGILLCYQDIRDKIFVASNMPSWLGDAECCFVDEGKGRIYAVVCGSGADPSPDGVFTSRTVLCLSQFTIRLLSSMEQIVSEVCGGSRPKETEFICISSVKTFTCSPCDDWNCDINGAFIL